MKKDTYTANFDFLQSANTSCCSENNEQHLIKIPNHCVFIRNTNTIDYLKTFNLKDLRRVFNKMIYKELMKMGEKFANSYPMTKTKKNNYVPVNVPVKYNFTYTILKLAYCFINLFDVLS